MTNNSNVKALISGGSDVAGKVIEALADHKISFVEVLGLVAPLTGISTIDFKAAKEEWTGADNESKADIIAYAQKVIDFKNDSTEDKVETVLGVLVYGGSLFGHNVAA